MSAVIIARMEKSVARNQIRRVICENNHVHRDVIKLVHLRSALIELSIHLSFNLSDRRTTTCRRSKCYSGYFAYDKTRRSVA